MATSTTSTSTTTTTTVKPRIRVLGPARYLVESTTRPGLGHQVDVLRLKCGCEAGRYGRRCRHLVMAIQQRGGPYVQPTRPDQLSHGR